MGRVKIAPVNREVTCQQLPLSRWQLLIPWNEVHLHSLDSLGRCPADDADVRDGCELCLFDKIPPHVMVSEDHPELRSLCQETSHFPGGQMDLIGHVSHQVVDHVTEEKDVLYIMLVSDGPDLLSDPYLVSEH